MKTSHRQSSLKMRMSDMGEKTFVAVVFVFAIETILKISKRLNKCTK